jgi:hypothetical protein
MLHESVETYNSNSQTLNYIPNDISTADFETAVNGYLNMLAAMSGELGIDAVGAADYRFHVVTSSGSENERAALREAIKRDFSARAARTRGNGAA